jgi:hypothetical protein
VFVADQLSSSVIVVDRRLFSFIPPQSARRTYKPLQTWIARARVL